MEIRKEITETTSGNSVAATVNRASSASARAAPEQQVEGPEKEKDKHREPRQRNGDTPHVQVRKTAE